MPRKRSENRSLNDRYTLAVAQNNLADFLSPDRRPALAIAATENAAPPMIAQERMPEAGPYFAQAVANLEKVVAAVPRSMEFQYVFGIVLDGQAEWLDRIGKLADARAALLAAVEHQRQAVGLSNNAPVCGLKLAEHLIHLAEVNRKLGAYEEAARLALEVPMTVPANSRPQACLDTARVLARVVAQLGADDKIHQAERERLTRTYLTRMVVLLREASDAGPKLAEEIRTDPNIQALKSRPEFQMIMNILVDVRG
jgi:tetratricopeptide (TPR) repeat protein